MTMLGGKSTGGGSFEVMEKVPAAEQSSSTPAAKRPAPAKSNFDNFDDDIPF